MFVKLLVLIVLACSLGELRDATQVTDEVSLLEFEPELTADLIVVEHPIARALPRMIDALAENLVLPPCSMDAGRVFRPPRLLAV